MAGKHRHRQCSELAVSAWLGAGATALGIGAALVGGAATAAAQPGDTHHSAGGTSHHRNSGPSATKHRSTSNTAPARRIMRHHKTNDRSAAATRPTAAVARVAEVSATPEGPEAPETSPVAAPEPAAQNSPADTPQASGSGTIAASTSRATQTARMARQARSVIATAAPDEVPNHTGPLAALATATQLASTPVETLTRTDGTTQSASSSDTSVATPGPSTSSALDAIGRAQQAVGFNLGSQICLAVAKWALTTWQQTNAAAVANYALHSTGLFGFMAKIVLDINAALPGIARSALLSAQAMTASNSTAYALIAQATDGGRVYGTVKLEMYNGTEPTINVSINGGPMVKVLVDTGSTGLVITNASVGTANLGPKIGSGTSGYSGGLRYGFDTYNATVDFGDGIITAPTPINIVNSTSESAYLKYMEVNGVVGVLGIGTNTPGPGPSLVSSALPGQLRDGVFIDEQAGVLQFGPNPRPVRTSVPGSPYTAGVVKVLGVSYPINLVIDSGGVYGTMPSTVWTAVGETQVPGGIPIEVYGADGSTLLYSYTTTNVNAPIITFDAAQSHQMNTGYTPFHLGPVYISYTTPGGRTYFDM